MAVALRIHSAAHFPAVSLPAAILISASQHQSHCPVWRCLALAKGLRSIPMSSLKVRKDAELLLVTYLNALQIRAKRLECRCESGSGVSAAQ